MSLNQIIPQGLRFREVWYRHIGERCQSAFKSCEKNAKCLAFTHADQHLRVPNLTEIMNIISNINQLTPKVWTCASISPSPTFGRQTY